MECNKDEANRAMSIAESKLAQNDFLVAKKFALKAQTLHPVLDGLSQMFAILDVHLSAEKKILSGEVDWYQVVGVDPSADYDTIKKQYRKLALMLHPDKNKFAGAEDAFKLLSEAWRLLSDKEKREEYNQRRGWKGLQQSVPTRTCGPSAPSWQSRTSQQKVPAASPRQSRKKVPSAPSSKKVPAHTRSSSASPQPGQHEAPARTTGASVPPWPFQQNVSTQMGGSSTPYMENGFFNFASSTTSTPKSQNGSAKMSKTKRSAPPHQRTDTFWTICRRCNVHFEYLKFYFNSILSCVRCEQAFMAIEIHPPEFYSKSARRIPWPPPEGSLKKIPRQNAYDPQRNVAAAQQPGASQTSSDCFMYTDYQQGPLPETVMAHGSYPSTAEKPGNIFQLAHGNLKRSHTETNASADLWEHFEKGKLVDGDSNRYGENYYMAGGSTDFGTGSASGTGFYGFSGTYSQPSSTRELTPLQAQNMLPQKAQKDIREKLSDSRL